MKPLLTIDLDVGPPPYQQLQTQLANAIRAGSLEPEDKLPTVRRMAADLGLSPNTVARAYQELERTGQVETRGRKGTFVASALAGENELENAALEFAGLARRLNVDPHVALEKATWALGIGPLQS